MITLEFSDEFGDEPIEELVELKAKLFSVLSFSKQKLPVKRVTNVAQPELTHDRYKKLLTTREFFREVNTRIGSHRHQLRQYVATSHLSAALMMKDSSWPMVFHVPLRSL